MMGKPTIKDIVLETYKNTKPITRTNFISELKQQFNSEGKNYADSSVNAVIRQCNLEFIEEDDQQSPDDNKTQTINRKGKTYRRSPKGRDKIQGRSSDAEIQARQKCCKKLYNTEPNLWNKKTFLHSYKKELKKIIKNIPTDNTLRNDIKKCGITFNGPKNFARFTDIQFNSFEEFGEKFGQHIMQIRIVCKNHDKILYNSKSAKAIENKNEFFKPLIKIENSYKPVNDPKKENSVKKTVSKNTLVHLYFIMNSKGLEYYLAEIFYNSTITERDFLYIEIHDFCVKVILEYHNLISIKDKIWAIADNMVV